MTDIPSSGTLLPFRFENIPVRGRFLRLGNLYAHVPSLAKSQPETAGALEELLALAALMMHDGAAQFGVSLQLQHAEHQGLMFARCTPAGELKAYANEAAREKGLQPLCDGTGIFAVT